MHRIPDIRLLFKRKPLRAGINEKILENKEFLAFLEPSPLKEGHTIVIPKKTTDYIFDLEDGRLSKLFVFAKKTARAVKKAVPCKKIAVMVYGLKVRHAHVHLVPVHGKAGELDFSRAKKINETSLARTAEKIRKYL